MKKFYTFVLAACACIAAGASSPQPVEIAEYVPDPMAPATTPSRAAALAADDAGYTEWQSLGTAPLGQGYDRILFTLNSYRIDGDEEIVFAGTTEVMMRQRRDDADSRQIKFCKLFGYNDMIAEYDAVTCTSYIPLTPTGMPIPTLLAENYGCTSIDFQCSSIQYSEARGVFQFGRPFFNIYDDMGFYTDGFNIMLPDAKPDIDFSFYLKAGGMKSTDKSLTLGINSNGIDHLRYTIKYDENFYTNDINSIIADTCEYKEANTEITVDYTKGSGYYRVLALAYDANDRYMGIYKISSLFSNLPPEGTWEAIGRGIWHHPDMPEYYVYDNETGESSHVIFPAEALQWEVDIEKRTDTDREIYRVVNPYSPTCGLADTFNACLDRMYSGDEAPYRPDAFRTDDTFWFVFDVTEPGNFSYEYGRPNGAGNGHFMSTAFYTPTDGTIQHATFENSRVCFPNYSYTDLIIDLPGYDSIDNAIIDVDANAPVEYYDMQGRRVTAPTAGIYILRKGSRSSKVYVK